MKLIKYIVILFIVFLFSEAELIAQKTIERQNKQIEKLDRKYKNTLNRLKISETKLAEKERELRQVQNDLIDLRNQKSGGTVVVTPPIDDYWKDKFFEEEKRNHDLENKNARLTRDKINLTGKWIREQQRVLDVENRLIAKELELETAKKELNEEITNLKGQLADLEDEISEFKKQVSDLESEIVENEKVISEQEKEIESLTNQNQILEQRQDKLIDVVKRKENEIDYISNLNLTGQLNLLSVYAGINYSLYNGNKRLQYESSWYSDYTFSFYNIFMGGGFFFQIPARYINVNGQIPKFETTPYYTIQDLEAYRLELDRLGDPNYSYTNFNYVESQGDFKIFNYGLNISVLRNFYLMAGLTQARGVSWDLYSGDLSAYGQKNGIDGEFPVKYNENYIVNYEELRVTKPMVGVVGAFALAKKKGDSKSRESRTQNYSPILNEQNNRFGFQIEVGYNWFYEDVFVNVGLHTRLANYNTDLLRPQEESFVSSNNVRDGIDFLLAGEKLNKKAETLIVRAERDDNNNARKVKKIKSKAEQLSKRGDEEIARGLNKLISALTRDSINAQKESDRFANKEFKIADSLETLAQNLGKLSRCLKLSMDKEGKERQDSCKACMINGDKGEKEELFKNYLPGTSISVNDALVKTLCSYFDIYCNPKPEPETKPETETEPKSKSE